jgi:hypothetical protein
LKSFKEIKEIATARAETKRIQKILKKSDFDGIRIKYEFFRDDMICMIENFRLMLDSYHNTQMKLFEVAGKDSIRVTGDKIYKDKESEEYETMKVWINDVRRRWLENDDRN